MRRKIPENQFPILFTDKIKITLDGLDGLASVWSPTRAAISSCVHCQQGGEGLMFLVVIIGKTLIEPFRAPESEKHTSQAYILLI